MDRIRHSDRDRYIPIRGATGKPRSFDARGFHVQVYRNSSAQKELFAKLTWVSAVNSPKQKDPEPDGSISSPRQ